jgi:hypothetical protein
MYQASIPVFAAGMRTLSAILEKGHADAVSRSIDPSVLLGSRLAPDMLPLTRQVQIASDMVKNGAGRLAGVELPSFADTETTFEELQARINKTTDFLATIGEESLTGSDTREIVLKFPGREMHFAGEAYLTSFVVPNLYFHMTTAYLILRHNGVPLGKMDFIRAS